MKWPLDGHSTRTVTTALQLTPLGNCDRRPYAEPCALEVFPCTPASYIVCTDDRLVNPDWSRRVARKRLNADVIELPGGHSPFLSRPDDLATLLHDRA